MQSPVSELGQQSGVTASGRRPRTKTLIITGYDDLLESIRLNCAHLEEIGELEMRYEVKA